MGRAEGRELQDSWNGLTLSWYSEEKARKGSFAALAGVEFDLKTESPSWQAIALGDTCLIHCRNGMRLKSLPLSRSDSFQLGAGTGGVRFRFTRKQHAISDNGLRQLREWRRVVVDV
jgi:hypothetical protein